MNTTSRPASAVTPHPALAAGPIDIPLDGVPCGHCGQPAAWMVIGPDGVATTHTDRRLLPCPKYLLPEALK